MKSEETKLIQDWIDDAKILLKCYLTKAQKIKRINRILKITSASVSTVLLTLIFILVRLQLLDKNPYIIIVSVIGLIASTLTIIVAFLNLPEGAQKCDISGSEYATIRKELEYLLNFESNSNHFVKSELKRINNKWDYIRKNSLPITATEIQKVKEK